ncbi:ATP-dependent Clp protease adaptor ClpS [Spirochaeta cellobiosiphila]|uniref:ATP-dependent Clp protease adaptor ClpS n=1 Tax=Spirochaeta cellobiosiphila TaxID=504483 RepID=UPI0003F8BC6F|nr:ATP-dependent Clp protease adaptor ClpS [Spirochaeta cellobiosiphila]
MAGNKSDISEKIKSREKDEVQEPNKYKVILHNDHYTTMEFVVHVLMVVFRKSTDEASKIMLDVHTKGKGLVGLYSLDIAKTKVIQVTQMAEKAEYPLKCTYEKA